MTLEQMVKEQIALKAATDKALADLKATQAKINRMAEEAIAKYHKL